MKILTILGARPQFIKASAISRVLQKKSNKTRAEEILVHTGQHYDANMSEVFFQELEIPKPKYNLGVSGLSHGAMTGRMMEGIEEIVQKENPNLILVYGDTNSTLAGALVASKLHIPLAHVEAGLRSFNARMPEEVNRILTDRVSTFLFCPTESAIKNLQNEGFPFPVPGVGKQVIEMVGDVMLDVVLHYKSKASELLSLKKWGLKEKNYLLCTIHRAENTDSENRLRSIFTALHEISGKIQVVLPMHPRTRIKIEEMGLRSLLENLSIIDPVSYLEMQRLQMDASLIMTDSGGIQKEAYFHQVPCITLRDETEWTETVESGWNILAGADQGIILQQFENYMSEERDYPSLFGDGDSSEKIVGRLMDSL